MVANTVSLTCLGPGCGGPGLWWPQRARGRAGCPSNPLPALDRCQPHSGDRLGAHKPRELTRTRSSTHTRSFIRAVRHKTHDCVPVKTDSLPGLITAQHLLASSQNVAQISMEWVIAEPGRVEPWLPGVSASAPPPLNTPSGRRSHGSYHHTHHLHSSTTPRNTPPPKGSIILHQIHLPRSNFLPSGSISLTSNISSKSTPAILH